MITKVGSTKIVNFMNSEARVLILGCGHTSRHSDYTLLYVLYQYTAH